MGLGKYERKAAFAACLFLAMAYAAPAVCEEPFDPQTALMTVIEPKIEADTTSASPLGDHYDPVHGTITFSTTDISLPGNDGIPVELRRWVPGDDYATGGPTGWAWNIPFIRGNYLDVKDGHNDTGWDWGNNTWHHGKNCTGSADTVVTDQGELVAGNAYWQGKLLHIPGVTSETFLTNSNGEQVTKSNFRITSCIENPDGQQGIIVAGPNGLTYIFNQIKSYYNRKPALKDPIVRTRLLMVTKIQDRFGNHVDYTYANGELSRISASDGRAITIDYEIDGLIRRPTVATAHGRTWTYSYQTGTYGRLTSVTLPDGHSKWEYDNVDVVAFKPIDMGAGYNQRFWVWPGRPIIVPGCSTTSDEYVAQVKSPWGLTSTYTFKRNIFYRSNVEPELYFDHWIDGYAISRTLYCTVKLSLINKSISGPGISTASFSYQYSTNRGTYTEESGLNDFLTGPFELPSPAVGGFPSEITPGTEVDYRTTTIIGPDRRTIFYVDRKFQSLNESRVVAQDVLNAAGTELLQRTENTYELGDRVGTHWYMCPCDGIYVPINESQVMNRINLTESVDKFYLGGGTDIYTTAISNFDSYGFALNSHASNNFSSYEEVVARAYLHDTNNGLIGLPLKTVVNGVAVSEHHYNALGQREWSKSFGKLKQSLAYDSVSDISTGQRGTIKTVWDGNGNATMLTDWKRGIPQTIQYADGNFRSGVVNDSGWIESLTDENGYTTNYGYDSLGQLASIDYPEDDSTPWASTTRTVEQVTASSEYGIAPGHWRETTATGDARRIVYYDALLRPLVTREFDASDESVTKRFQRFTYDLDGRATFASYPGTTDALSTGFWVDYDALGRVTSSSQDSEKGLLTTLSSYLSSARIQVVNPRGMQTTTSYMAYGQPSTDWPVLIVQPEGAYTDIVRDHFGKPISITRRNSNGSVAITRSMVYDSNQQLCKTIEPETAATVMGYDAAGNLIWSASGQPLPDPASCNAEDVPFEARVLRSYDVRNRLESLSFPDGRGDQDWFYTPDGLPQTIITANDNLADTATNEYVYNKRRLLTQETLTLAGMQSWSLGYSYSNTAALSTITYPDGEPVSYGPNALGQPTHAGGYALGIYYFPNGGMQTFTYGNGIVHTLTQNERQLPKQSADTGIFDDTYGYDENANVSRIEDGLFHRVRTRSMTYDGLDRLVGTASRLFGSSGASFSYDVLDNVTHALMPVGIGLSQDRYFCYDENWRLTNLKTGNCSNGSTVTGLGYEDGRGNVTNKNGQHFEFDYGNRLRAAVGLENYRYDGHGRRVSAQSGSGTVYSFYGHDGVLRYQHDERRAKDYNYISLNGSLLARKATDIIVSTVPAAPVLSAPASSITGDYSVVWSDVSRATRYVLEEQVSGGGWVEIQNSSQTGKEFSGKGEGAYSYRARACNNNDECSIYSAIVTVVVNIIAAPEAPELTVPATSNTGSFTVSWTPADGATWYRLEEKAGSSAWVEVQVGDAISKQLSGKATGVLGYRVRACSDSNPGSCGPYSAAKSITVTLPPDPPSLSVPERSYTGAYTASWNNPAGATHYRLEEQSGSGAWDEIQATSGTSAALSGKANGTFNYRVRACIDTSIDNCSGYSSVESILVTLRPETPVVTVPGSSDTGAFTVGWSSIGGAEIYRLEEKIGSGSWAEIESSDSTSKSFTGKPLGLYSYRVRACLNMAIESCSEFSSIESISVTPTPPNLLVHGGSNNGDYTVSWSTESGATRYRLEEKVGSGAWSEILHDSVTDREFYSQLPGAYSYRARACGTTAIESCSGYSQTKSITIEPPAAPTLTLPATSTTGNYTASWNSVSGATRYRLEEKVASGSWTEIQNGSATSKVLSGKSSGNYSYRVRACSGTTTSTCWSYSAVKNIEVNIPPVAPTLTLPATSTSGNYTASWNSVSGATRYRLEEKVASGSWTEIQNGSATSKALSGKPDGTYSYRVRACSGTASSTCGSYSAIKSISVDVPPDAPIIFIDGSNGGDYTVSWSAEGGATRYRLEEKVGSGAWSEILHDSVTDREFFSQLPGTYSYRARACGSTAVDSCGDYSQTKSITITAPAAPTLTVPATSDTGSYTVSWNSVSGATRYRLQEMAPGGSWTEIQNASATSKALSGKTDGTYSYRVRACSGTSTASCGSYSTAKNIEVDTPPDAPTIFIDGSNYGDYTVSWSAESGATRYRLEEKVGSGAWSEILHDSVTDREFYSQLPGTYSYRARACGSTAVSSCGNYSQAKSITITAPVAPTLTVPATSDTGSYTVSWNSVSGATRYRLQEKAPGGSWTEIQNGSATSKALSGKTDGTYSYRIRACSGTSTASCGSYSTAKNVEVGAPLDAPLLIVHGNNNGDYTVSWNAVSGATRYRLEEKVNGGDWSEFLNESVTDWEFYSQYPGTYSYRVRACRNTSVSSCGNYSLTKSFTVH